MYVQYNTIQRTDKEQPSSLELEDRNTYIQFLNEIEVFEVLGHVLI